MKTNRKIDPLSEKKRSLKRKFVDEEQADWDRYSDDVEKSECFEVGHYPHMDLRRATGLPVVRRIYDLSHTDESLEDDMLLYLSKLAICFYNIREATHFCHVKVVLVTRFGIKCENHYITFQAFPSKTGVAAVTFQTHLLVNFLSQQFEIMFVRIKPSELDQNKCQQGQPSESNQDKDQIYQQAQPSGIHHDKDKIYQRRLSRVIGRYTIGSGFDSQYSLALYLSQYALFTYNFFTLSESVAKHDIESLKVVKLTKPNANMHAFPLPNYSYTGQVRRASDYRLIRMREK